MNPDCNPKLMAVKGRENGEVAQGFARWPGDDAPASVPFSKIKHKKSQTPSHNEVLRATCWR
ncbi:hypothetical protein BDV10DRAFT_131812 [Aspergillus recurvatus]